MGWRPAHWCRWKWRHAEQFGGGSSIRNNPLSDASTTVVAATKALLGRQDAPLVIAIDGGSGAGKSTLASLVAETMNVAWIPLDDFFAATIPDTQWEQFSAAEKLEHVFEWERVRLVIGQLLEGRPGRWQAFDFATGPRADGTYGRQGPLREQKPAPVVMVEGAYAAGPALADLVDLTVLVDVPVQERHARLRQREDAAFLVAWHARWDEVEAYYFGEVCPPTSFDLVVKG